MPAQSVRHDRDFRTELSFPVNVNYRLRLEAVGPTIKAYLNGMEVLRILNGSLTHGQPALMSYKTSVDFDNVIVSPSPQTAVLFDADFTNVTRQWTPIAGSWSSQSDPNLYMQSSTTGGASSITGSTIAEQSVQATVRQVGMGTGTQTWFGLLARYRDASNYYYVTLRNSGEISLRRLLNGTAQVLDSAPFSVAPHTAYRLRLEAIQDQLRVYVDDRLILEATDSAIAEGRQGAVMYKSATQYDDVLITQP